MKKTEPTEHGLGDAKRLPPVDSEADRPQQDEGEPVTKEDEIELGREEGCHDPNERQVRARFELSRHDPA